MSSNDRPKTGLLDANVRAQCADPEYQRLVVGYSGGVDSHVLLASLCELGLRHKLLAFHVNHGLSPQASAWQNHCRQVCDDLGVAFATVTLHVQREGNLEDNARRARYGAFAHLLEKGDLLLLGQHQDDQVETALFQLFRGSGRFGLQGMPLKRQIGQASLLRPLLTVSRARILAYAQQSGLSWIEDESNLYQAMSRNYLRHALIPQLERRWPSLKSSLVTSLQRDAEAILLLEDVARTDQERLRNEWGGICLNGFSRLSPARQKNLLIAWLARYQLPYPSAGLLEEGLRLFLAAKSDTLPEMRWQGGLFKRFRQGLYLLRGLPAIDQGPFYVSGGAPVTLQGGALVCTRQQGRGLRISDPDRLEVSGRCGGESLQLGRNRSLKKLLQERHVPTWLRDRLPLIYLEGELIAIAGLPDWHISSMVSSLHEATGDQWGWVFEFEIEDRYRL